MSLDAQHIQQAEDSLATPTPDDDETHQLEDWSEEDWQEEEADALAEAPDAEMVDRGATQPTPTAEASPPPSGSEVGHTRYTSPRRVTLRQALWGDERPTSTLAKPEAPARIPPEATPPLETPTLPEAPTLPRAALSSDVATRRRIRAASTPQDVAPAASVAPASRVERTRKGGRRRPTLTQLRRERLGRYPALTASLAAAMRRMQRERWREIGFEAPPWSQDEADAGSYTRDLAARREARAERRGRRRLVAVLLVGAICAALTLGIVGMLTPSAIATLTSLLPHAAPVPTATPPMRLR